MKHKFLQPFQGSRKWMTFALTAQLMVAASAAEGHPFEHKSTLHSSTTMVKGLVDVTITGTVTDANGEPIPGVTVMVSGPLSALQLTLTASIPWKFLKGLHEL